MKHIKYPKIQQFRNIVSEVNRQVSFNGFDDNGDSIYNKNVEKPKLTFNGTVKIHGTNAGVCFNSNDGLWAQSRENLITTLNDNFGFAFFVETKKVHFSRLIDKIRDEFNIDTSVYTISIYGEWAGGNIQKNVGVSETEKAFYVFGVKISKLGDDDFVSYWVESKSISDNDNKIYNVNDFKTFQVEVDFNMPELAQKTFSDITEEVENECPVAKHFGVSGIGEGVVWTVIFNGNTHRFKVKGEKHSVTKVKKLASVDIEKLNSINEFVEYAVTENRIDQAVEKVFNDKDLDIKKLGDFIRWIINDITSEEMDTMVENNLEPKDVNKYISNKARTMFFNLLEL